MKAAGRPAQLSDRPQRRLGLVERHRTTLRDRAADGDLIHGGAGELRLDRIERHAQRQPARRARARVVEVPDDLACSGAVGKDLGPARQRQHDRRQRDGPPEVRVGGADPLQRLHRRNLHTVYTSPGSRVWKSARTVTTTIGLDVGGTKVSLATLRDGHLDDPVLAPTVTSSSDALVEQLASIVSEAGPADAVGIGIPSVVDFEHGMALASVNIPLQNVPLRRVLSQRLGVPVFVDNDANVAALAEAHDDDGVPIADTLVMLTVGTGVGGGIVIGGRIYRGATGAARRARPPARRRRRSTGGAPPHADQPPQPGSLEQLAAGRALDRLAAERGLSRRPDRREGRPGRRPARRSRRSGSSASGSESAIANAINVFDPELVVDRRRRFGGRRAAAGPGARDRAAVRPAGRRHGDRDPARSLRPAGRRPRRGADGRSRAAPALGPDPRDVRSGMKIAVAFDHAGVGAPRGGRRGASRRPATSRSTSGSTTTTPTAR